jgi:hypothetical protein
LYRLNDLETSFPTDEIPALTDLYSGALQKCKTDVEKLHNQLQKAVGATGLKRLGKQVFWPGTKKDIDKALARIEQNEMVFTLALSSDHARQGIKIKQTLNAIDQRLASGRVSDRHENILRWLNRGLDPFKNHYDACKKHQPNTGVWLLCQDQYIEWKLKPSLKSLMWLHGIPGCGKTILCSTVINDLQQELKYRTNSALAYFYYDFSEEDNKKNISAMLRSLLGQLACQTDSLKPEIDSLYVQCGSGSRSPSEEEVGDTLWKFIENFDRVYVVVDALDESAERDEIPAILAGSHKLRVLIASRFNDDIKEAIRQYSCVEIPIGSQIDDIRVHIKSRLEHDRKIPKLRPSDKSRIEEVLANNSDGM